MSPSDDPRVKAAVQKTFALAGLDPNVPEHWYSVVSTMASVLFRPSRAGRRPTSPAVTRKLLLDYLDMANRNRTLTAIDIRRKLSRQLPFEITPEHLARKLRRAASEAGLSPEIVKNSAQAIAAFESFKLKGPEFKSWMSKDISPRDFTPADLKVVELVMLLFSLGSRRNLRPRRF